MRRRGGTAVVGVVLVALAGCGKQDAPTASTPKASTGTAAPKATPPPTSSTPAPKARSPFLPPAVPQSGGSTAPPEQLAVVKRWLTAETHADFGAAADTFADGALVENASPVLKLRDRKERLAFTSSFPCGAEVVSASSKKGYLLVTYRLTDRVGSKCDGPGNEAYGAIKVSRGKMTEWYRLADPPQAPGGKTGPVV